MKPTLESWGWLHDPWCHCDGPWTPLTMLRGGHDHSRETSGVVMATSEHLGDYSKCCSTSTKYGDGDMLICILKLLMTIICFKAVMIMILLELLIVKCASAKVVPGWVTS